MQRLASEYLTATGRRASGRIGQIKYLLRDAIRTFADEDEDQAELVKDLFFGDSQNRVTKSAGELLDTARRKSGSNEARFRQARHDAFDSFATFIPRFVASAQPEAVAEGATEGTAEGAPYTNYSVVAPDVQRQVATAGYIDDSEHFISLLSQAKNVTIVGFTNESLVSILRTALARKREAILQSDECWSSIRVVFLGEELLDWVNDERGFPDPDEARLIRRQQGVFGRRAVRGFPARPSSSREPANVRFAAPSAADWHAVRDARWPPYRAAPLPQAATECQRSPLPGTRGHPRPVFLGHV